MGALLEKLGRTVFESIRKVLRLWWRFHSFFKRDGADERIKAQSNTTLYDLPLEMLDIILQKSYLHWIYNSQVKRISKEVIRSLTSVDSCFNRRITRQRFKEAICRYSKDYYEKTKPIRAIIRNNRNYLQDNIQPNGLITSLFLLNCITEKESHIIQRQRDDRNKNKELLEIMKSVDQTKFSNFVKCLRNTNQTTVAKVIENGGGVVKTRVAKCTETQLLHKKIEALQHKTNPRSHETDQCIAQLREEGIEILSSQLDGQTVVVWIWCRRQAAIANVQRLYESNELRKVFFEMIHPSILTVINMDATELNKTLVECPTSINFNHRIEIQGNEYLCGITKLQKEIYLLCQAVPRKNVIRVFKDQSPFLPQKEIELKDVKAPYDIGSSVMKNCLYICDNKERCVWKTTKETNDQHKTIKWLTTDYEPVTLSVSSDGQLVMINISAFRLMIYGSDAELIRWVRLPLDIMHPCHAVETFMGNFIVIHPEENHVTGNIGRIGPLDMVFTELNRDGHTVMRRSVSLYEPRQQVFLDFCHSLDSDDRVFVADTENDSVILLDSDLKWNRILCSIKEEKKDGRKRWPRRLCYDEEIKQLIVGRPFGDGVNVYSLSRN